MTEEPNSADGTRGRTRWVIAGVALVVLLVAGTWATVTVLDSPGCVDTARPKSYRIDELREHFDPRAVSPDGRYIAGRGFDGGRDVLMLWHDGEYTEIDGPDDGASTPTPVDVNDSSVIVGGSAGRDTTGMRSWRYQDGEFQELTGPDGEPGPVGVHAVAEDGTAVGQFDVGKPMLWPADETEATRLPLPESDHMAWNTLDISDTGTVVSTVGGKLRLWDGGDTARVLADVPDNALPFISDDWVLADGRRWHLTEDREYPKLDTEAWFHAIDSCGRGYGGSGELDARPILDDGEVRRLPELDEDGFERDEPENPYGVVRMASADGAVLVGRSMGRPVMWTYD